MTNTIILFVWTVVTRVSLVIITMKMLDLTGNVGIIGTIAILWAFSLGGRGLYKSIALEKRCETLEARIKELEQTTW